jgi:serine protease Do
MPIKKTVKTKMEKVTTEKMDYETRVRKVVKTALPSVVSVAIAKDLAEVTSEITNNPLFRNPYDRAFLETRLREAPRDEQGRVKIGGGSGFIITSDGFILTNKHVVSDVKADYSVILNDGRKFDAKVKALDPLSDIAILKVESHDLPSLELGASKQLELGQTVIAIGNALNEFQNTVSKGVVSGLSRLITAMTDGAGHQERLRGLIQTDAAINPGNSGGPMIDLDAKVVGINSAVVFGAQNIGFAIPIEQAKRDLEEIRKFGRIRRPYVGLRHLIINHNMRERMHLPVEYGAFVMSEGIMPGGEAVLKGSPSDKAGLREFDIVLKCNGKDINEENTLEDMLSTFDVGQEIKLTVLRAGELMEKMLKLEEHMVESL